MLTPVLPLTTTAFCQVIWNSTVYGDEGKLIELLFFNPYSCGINLSTMFESLATAFRILAKTPVIPIEDSDLRDTKASERLSGTSIELDTYTVDPTRVGIFSSSVFDTINITLVCFIEQRTRVLPVGQVTSRSTTERSSLDVDHSKLGPRIPGMSW